MEQSKHDYNDEKNPEAGSDPGYHSDDSSNDPSFIILDESHAKFSKLSIETKSKARTVKIVDVEDDLDGEEVVVVPQRNQKDTKSFELVQNMIRDKQVEKLKLEQCKLYLRKNGLRLTGNKETLIQRIKEHLEVVNGGGENKYPAFSFVLNCKGDACTGDVVMFEHNVYEMFDIASRTGRGPPCGTRIVAGRIVKESYGAAKQQHTFTIEVLWSKGEKPLPPLHPLLIKGRNLYRLKTLRQRWEDEGERQKALMEKHSRGSLARSDRESRIQEKEMRKSLKTKRVSKKVEPKSSRSQFNSTASLKSSVQPPMDNAAHACQPLAPKMGPQQLRMFTDSTQTHHSDLVVNSQQPATLTQDPLSLHPGKVTTQSQVRRNTTMPDRYSKAASAYLDMSRVSVNNGREYHSSNSKPNVHGVTVTSLPSFTEFQRLPSRQPLASVNHCLRQGQKQMCRHYAQGRCSYGENCKFSHGENYSERRGERCPSNCGDGYKFPHEVRENDTERRF